MQRRWKGLAAAIAVSASLVACSSGGSSSAKAGKSPAAILAASATKTANAGTAKADLGLDFASIPGVKGPISVKGFGELDLKAQLGHMHLDLTPLFNAVPEAQRGSLPPNAGDVDIIYANKIVYMKAPVFASVAPSLKPWLKIDLTKANGQNSLAQLQQLGGGNDPAQQLKLLNQAGNVKVEGSEDVRGTATTHYSATIDLDKAIAGAKADEKAQYEALKKQTGSTTLPLQVWIDEQGRTRRFKTTIEGKSQDAATATAFTTTLEYYDFGTSVKVDVPAADQVSDLSALTSGGGGATTTAPAKKP